MAKTDMLHIRIGHDTKVRVESTLGLLGLTVSDAICIFLSQVELNGGIPFDVRLPVLFHERIAEGFPGPRKIASAETKGIEPEIPSPVLGGMPA